MAEAAERTSFNAGALIQRMVDIRDERRRLKERDSELSNAWSDIEQLLLEQLDAQGAMKVATEAGTAAISEAVLPRVENWDALHAHLRETGDLHFLHRRVSSAAFRELHEAGIDLPGVRGYVQRTISLRKR